VAPHRRREAGEGFCRPESRRVLAELLPGACLQELGGSCAGTGTESANRGVGSGSVVKQVAGPPPKQHSILSAILSYAKRVSIICDSILVPCLPGMD